MSPPSATTATTTLIRQKYRQLGRLVQKLPEAKYDPQQSWDELRTAFKTPLTETETLEQRLAKADERRSFLQMITPKSASQDTKGGKWVYKNGQRLEHVNGTVRDSNGRVVSNWDGKNLDPDSVKRHNHHLKRLGFRNNAHAKGIF
ncbi:hypothetical protein IV203_028958 [Nitzschia inconspicua]|uniref:Complex 1 LYR protein n=1 Tax=Nitzschia inconspicua TaxID=303405 RepID=A0A9K3LQU2_9STRA|nr:hypothetical protein IV203_028958 [Nitzschia inconspicua]